MLMTEIRKESLAEVESVNEAMTTLAESAKSVLGYDVLAKITAKAATVECTGLRAALKSLDIEVLLASDVRKYMKERQIEQTVANMQKWIEKFAADDEIGQWVRFDGPAWVRAKIAEYKEPVPEFVLAKAVQIKQAFPECEIWVESLKDHPDPFLSVGIPDTKYTWSDPTELYYVEVWEEPKFEGRL
jgi:hypothetical protein